MTHRPDRAVPSTDGGRSEVTSTLNDFMTQHGYDKIIETPVVNLAGRRSVTNREQSAGRELTVTPVKNANGSYDLRIDEGTKSTSLNLQNLFDNAGGKEDVQLPDYAEELPENAEGIKRARKLYDSNRIYWKCQYWFRAASETHRQNLEWFLENEAFDVVKLGRYCLPEGVSNLASLNQWELARECMLYGIAAHQMWPVPTVQERMRGCNRDVMVHQSGKTAQKEKYVVTLKDVNLGSTDLAFGRKGMQQGMSHEHFMEQRRLLEASVAYNPSSYPDPDEPWNWTGDAMVLFSCLTLASDRPLDDKIKGKVKELVAADAGLSSTFVLYEIVMKFVESLCCDDYRTQANKAESNYNAWHENKDATAAPYQVLLSFTAVLDAYETTRRTVMGEKYHQLDEYETVNRFLNKCSDVLRRTIKYDLVRKYEGVHQSTWTWAMVTAVVDMMRAAEINPAREYKILTQRVGDRVMVVAEKRANEVEERLCATNWYG